MSALRYFLARFSERVRLRLAQNIHCDPSSVRLEKVHTGEETVLQSGKKRPDVFLPFLNIFPRAPEWCRAKLFILPVKSRICILTKRSKVNQQQNDHFTSLD